VRVQGSGVRVQVSGARTLKPLRASLLASIAIVLPAKAAPEPANFQYFRELQPSAALVFDIGAVKLDEAMFADTDNNYANLRVFKDAKLEVPMLVRPRRAIRKTVSEVPLRAKRGEFEILPDNRIHFTLTPMNAGESPVAVVFSSQQKNFEKLVTVKGSNDHEKWETLVEDEPIFDYSRFMDIRNVRVNIPERAYRYYRVELSNISENHQSPLTQIVKDKRSGGTFSEVESNSFRRQDFRIDNVTLRGKKKTVGKSAVLLREYTATDFKAELDEKQKQTVISFNTSRAPLTEVIVHTDDVNFIRDYSLQARDSERATWRHLARGKLSRIRAGRFNQYRLTISTSRPTRYRHYRLTVWNQDNPALDFSGVSVRGETHESLFFVEQDASYQISYGAKGMSSPVYDIAQVLQKVETAETATFKLGEPQDTDGYRAGGQAAWGNSKTLLAVVVILVVIVLAVLIARAVKQVDTMSGD
jgi:hypothetical protein